MFFISNTNQSIPGPPGPEGPQGERGPGIFFYVKENPMIAGTFLIDVIPNPVLGDMVWFVDFNENVSKLVIYNFSNYDRILETIPGYNLPMPQQP